MAVPAIIALIAGCNAAHEKNGPVQEAAEASIAAPVPPTAQEPETGRKFIRTSDMRFRVKDVATATYRIEEVTRLLGGFVTYTHLESTIDEKKTARISRIRPWKPFIIP